MSDSAHPSHHSGDKSVALAYVLLLLLGQFGAHRYYLGEKETATALLVITLISLVLMTVGIGFLTIWISFAWVIVDLFLVPRMVRNAQFAAA